MAPISRLRAYSGPALLSYGFRPFFLFGSIYAGLSILAWLPMFQGELELSTLLAPRDWHVHEMLYGYLPAVITGFLLTAIPNWTGRLPLQGKSLLLLVIAWMLGRIAVTMSAWFGWLPAAAIDLSFLLLVTAAAGREIVSGRNWRNLKVLIALGLLLAGNAIFHLEAHFHGTAEYGTRLGIAVVVLLIMLIGGRIIPSFTLNWIARENPGRRPIPFGRYDMVAMIVAGAGLLAWVALPDWPGTGVILVAAGLLHALRLARWAGDRTWRDRLVLILHIAYAFIPLGFVLLGAASLGYLPPAAGIHAWTGGAAGSMTLAVMSRASLGHAGRQLIASGTVQVVYLLIVASALLRVCASLHDTPNLLLINLAGIAWAAAFLGFALAYWGIFTRPAGIGEVGSVVRS